MRPGGARSGDGPLVSVVIPAHNAAEFLRQALDTALAQTHRDLEVIIIDDGSLDETAAIAEAAAARDPRVVLIRQNQGGVAAARNAGIAAARGEFVAPLDADDLWHPNKLAEQIAAFRRVGRETALVYSWVISVDEEGCVMSSSGWPTHAGPVYPHLVFGNFICCASMPLIRRQYLIEAGGYDQSLRARRAQGAEDLKLYLTLAERYHFAVVPKVLVGYRQHLRNMSGDIRQMWRSLEFVLAEVRDRHPALPGVVFRWAAGNHYYWMAQRSAAQGEYRQAFDLLLRAIRSDPLLIVRMPRLAHVVPVKLVRSLLPESLTPSGRRRTPFGEFPLVPEVALIDSIGAVHARRRAFLDELCRRWPGPGLRLPHDPATAYPSDCLAFEKTGTSAARR